MILVILGLENTCWADLRRDWGIVTFKILALPKMTIRDQIHLIISLIPIPIPEMLQHKQCKSGQLKQWAQLVQHTNKYNNYYMIERPNVPRRSCSKDFANKIQPAEHFLFIFFFFLQRGEHFIIMFIFFLQPGEHCGSWKAGWLQQGLTPAWKVGVFLFCFF